MALEMIPIADLRTLPEMDHTFDAKTLTAIEFIRVTFNEQYPQTLEEWVRGFCHDMHPLREIALWLVLARGYSQWVADHPKASGKKRKKIYELFLCSTMQNIDDVVRTLKMSPPKAQKIFLKYLPSALRTWEAQKNGTWGQ